MKSPTRSEPAFWTSLPELYRYFSARLKRHLFALLALMVLGAVAELATLGSLMPFLALLSGTTAPRGIATFSSLFAAAGVTTSHDQLWAAAILFAIIALVSGTVRIVLNWSTQIFTARLGYELSVDVQRRILSQPYTFHLKHNSSEAVAAMDKVEALVVHVLLQLIYATAATIIAIAIIAALIYADAVTTSIAAAAFTVLYLVVSAASRPRLTRNSQSIRTSYEERVRIVQESISGIRDVIVDGAQNVYLSAFAEVSRRYGTAAATTAFMAAAPRFVVEAAGMVVIAVVAVLVAAREGNLTYALPLLGAIALGAQRLLPLLQQVYHGWASISGHRSLMVDVLQLLRLPIPAEENPQRAVEPLTLRNTISMKGVTFAYPGSPQTVLDHVSLEIPCGLVLGIVGKTGSGKSTLADLIMGLIEPTQGVITVDGTPLTCEARQAWQRAIAHVPQAIFLADATISQNIAFGVSPAHIDRDRIQAAAAMAHLHEFVAGLPDGYETTIGERGVRLSGGQRQRLGIARAIYKEAPVLVLDEATSALDDSTEAAVLGALAALRARGHTIIIIAHRLSTLEHCDQLVRLEDGRIRVTGSHPDVIGLMSAEH